MKKTPTESTASFCEPESHETSPNVKGPKIVEVFSNNPFFRIQQLKTPKLGAVAGFDYQGALHSIVRTKNRLSATV